MRIRYLLAVVICMACAQQAFSQATTSSPYSNYGIGLIEPGDFSLGKHMGGLSTALHQPLDINVNNPASYTGIAMMTFEMGMFGGLRNLQRGDLSQQNRDFGIGHLAMAFPVIQGKWGASFGLMPFSNVGYQVTNSGTLGQVDVNYINRGEGGVTQFYIGNAVAITKNLSVGLNVAYLFGNIKEDLATEFPGNSAQFLNSRTVNAIRPQGFHFSYGIQGEVPLAERVKLTYGYSGNAGTDLRTKSDVLKERYIGSLGSETTADTLSYTEGVSGDTELPMSHRVGFAVSSKNKWLFGLDANYADWSGYERDERDEVLGKSFGLSAGAQFKPDPTAVSNYWKVVEYRAGFKYQRLPMVINDQHINQAAFTVGFGLPLRSQEFGSFGKLNIGAELGQRGKNSNRLIKEQYAMFNIGVIFSSSQWFRKRQFD